MSTEELMEERWFYKLNNGKHGPLSTEGISNLFASGKISADNEVWRYGMPDWVAGHEIEAFSHAIRSSCAHGACVSERLKSTYPFRIHAIVCWLSEHRKLSALTLLCLVVLLVFAWRGRGPMTYGVEGDVTVAGIPVEVGSISFHSTGAGGVSAAGAVITDGKFSVSRQRGLMPGVYQIQVAAFHRTGKAVKTAEGTLGHETERIHLRRDGLALLRVPEDVSDTVRIDCAIDQP